MKNSTLQTSSVYPGQFVSLNDETEIIEQSKNSPDDDPHLPDVKIKPLMHEYKIEVTIPAGIEREKLIVFGENNLLLVCYAFVETGAQKGNIFRRHIQLPKDADVQLGIAEYKNNFLYCFVPKAMQPCRLGKARIVVY